MALLSFSVTLHLLNTHTTVAASVLVGDAKYAVSGRWSRAFRARPSERMAAPMRKKAPRLASTESKKHFGNGCGFCFSRTKRRTGVEVPARNGRENTSKKCFHDAQIYLSNNTPRHKSDMGLCDSRREITVDRLRVEGPKFYRKEARPMQEPDLAVGMVHNHSKRRTCGRQEVDHFLAAVGVGKS